MAQDFSPIQNHILSKLKNAKSLRYSELMPDYKVPNDLFNYHLQFLVKKGFLIKVEDFSNESGVSRGGYALSEVGVKHMADPILSDNKVITSLFKINVITIVSRIIDGKLYILNQVRNSNPSFGKVGVMGGVVWKGEGVLDAASRKLKQETGLDANFKYIGAERRIMYVEEELFSDVLFPIAYTNQSVGEPYDTDFGKNMWVPIDEAIENDTKDEFDCIEAISKVLMAIKDGSIDNMPVFYCEVTKKGVKQPYF